VRKALNENPLVQFGLIGVLALIVGVMVLTRMGGSEPAPAPAESTSAEATPVPAGGAGAEAAPAPGAPATSAAVSSAPSDAAPAGAASPAAGGFKAGPGLPQPVVSAYEDGKIVALLVMRENGIDDKRMRAIVESLRARSDTAVFVVRAKGIARYSRIAQGVQVQRTPALVVLTPKARTEGPLPTATVSYGFQGPKSVVQAIEDAAYKGPSDLPYYPTK
jgi:hypothetical protein